MWDKFEDFLASVLNIEKSCTTNILHAADADKFIAASNIDVESF